MPTTSKQALPYPAADANANVPADIQALANRLETLMSTNFIQRGTVTVTFSNSPSASATATFPTPYANAVYSAAVWIEGTPATNQEVYVPGGGKTATALTVTAFTRNGAATTGALTVSWLTVGPI